VQRGAGAPACSQDGGTQGVGRPHRADGPGRGAAVPRVGPLRHGQQCSRGGQPEARQAALGDTVAPPQQGACCWPGGSTSSLCSLLAACCRQVAPRALLHSVVPAAASAAMVCMANTIVQHWQLVLGQQQLNSMRYLQCCACSGVTRSMLSRDERSSWCQPQLFMAALVGALLTASHLLRAASQDANHYQALCRVR